MPYELTPERNVMEITCKLSGKTFELYYRMPENAERLAYDNAISKRKGAQIKIAKDWMLTQAKMGSRLCIGFRKGDFSMAGKIIATESTDPDYYADWKNLLYRVRPDLLAHLARTIFGAISEKQPDELDDEDDEGVIEKLDDPDFGFDEPEFSTPAAPEAASTENP